MNNRSEVAFKTADQVVVAAWKDVASRCRDLGNRAVDEAKDIGKNKGLMVQRTLGDEAFVGLAPIDPADPPEGWRYVRDQFEPRRGKVGDDARDWLKSIQLPSLRDAMQEFGLPKLLFKNGFMRTPAMFLHDETIWVIYGDEPDEIGPLWSPCRLSEFYAAQEGAESAIDKGEAYA